ncbi:MAG: hypothetical protein AAGA66_11270 [Bacteroidota bacterium]
MKEFNFTAFIKSVFTLFVFALMFTNCSTDEDLVETIATPEASTATERVINVTGYYRGNGDNGHYYIRQIGNTVFWFGEDPGGRWANVFRGTLSGSRLQGTFYDVPKGRNQGIAPLTLQVFNNGNTLTENSPFFGASTLTKTTKPSSLPAPRAQGFGNVGNINDLTARWETNGNGVYYVRQVGGTVVWFGEQNNGTSLPIWANVAFGTRTGNTIQLTWMDVPKGGNGGTGEVTLRVVDANTLSKTGGTGNYFGSINWERN